MQKLATMQLFALLFGSTFAWGQHYNVGMNIARTLYITIGGPKNEYFQGNGYIQL